MRPFKLRLNPCLCLLTAALLSLLLAGSAAWAQSRTPLLPGVYQPVPATATALVSLQDDGSLLMRFWQGESTTPPSGGFAYLSRLVAGQRGRRLTGVWQSLPGSCCPGRGRQELEVIDAEAFRFLSFAPNLDQAAWPVDPNQVFRRVASLPVVQPAQRLAGVWRLAYWYTDLLPQGAPADLNEGVMVFKLLGDGLQGTWQGHAGHASLIPQASGARLEYADPAANFSLEAQLREDSGGLALSGPFRSSLGQGQMMLVRAALPANPPGPQLDDSGRLSGIWVDTRTGSDFFKISGSEAGISFTVYGGSLAQPRYLARGRAMPAGPDTLEGGAQDQPGYCCGNQATLSFKLLGPERMQVTALWWPQGRQKPAQQQAESYVLQRMDMQQAAAAQAQGGWPQVVPGRPGVPDTRSGAVRVVFTYQPQGPPREQALFSRGGYGRTLEIYLDSQGRPCARIDTAQGQVLLRSEAPVSPQEQHRLWLMYNAGGKALLFLDGQETASAPMPQGWAGSAAPYLIGGSRWPNRAFAGQIQGVQLWAAAPEPNSPEPPQLTLSPGETQPSLQQTAQAKRPATHTLVRLWHPGRLLHAYAADAAAQRAWEAQGFIRQGPVARLWTQERPGLKALWGFLHNRGYTILQTDANLPPGCRALGLLGYVQPQAQAGATPLWGLKADFPDPLRGGSRPDMLYTSRQDQLEEASRDGYVQPHTVGYVLPAQEPALARPMLYTWGGFWRGEGWGRFFLGQRGQELYMFWYYSNLEGPHFFGRYQLSEGGRVAQGIAVSGTGTQARYYRHRLVFDAQAKSGPRVKLTSWRLAAPLDDGRLVVFRNPRPSDTELLKAAQKLPAREEELLKASMAQPSPQEQYQQALSAARAQGRLLER